MSIIPKISIIVPVYNVEKYLVKCLESILAQTFSDFEVLLVDDGSTDRSGQVCDDYAKKDIRFRVFHKENGGVASARQAGTDLATGDYIIHVDPDDWVESNMLEELYLKAVETGADVVICDYYVEYKNRRIYKKQQPSALDSTTVLKELFQQLHGSCWNKLVKRACYKKYDITFVPGINYCEDVLIWVQLLQHTEVKVCYLNKAFYHYWQENENSIIHSKSVTFLESRKKYVNYLSKIHPPELNKIVPIVKAKVYLHLWKYNVISTGEFRNSGFGIIEILKLNISLKEKVGGVLAYWGFRNIARFVFFKISRPLFFKRYMFKYKTY